jgi:DNA/RNA non-specific endonuclease
MIKKLIICCVLFFGIAPVWKNNTFTIFNTSAAQAQNAQAELTSYLQWYFKNVEIAQGLILTNYGGNGANMVQAQITWPNGSFQITVFSAEQKLVNTNPHYVQYQNQLANQSSANSYTNTQTNAEWERERQEWADFDSWLFGIRQLQQLEQQLEYDLWYNEFAFGHENTGSGGPNANEYCSSNVTAWVDYNFSEAFHNTPGNNGTNAPAANLPCTNKYMIGTKIGSFNAGQLAGITDRFFVNTDLAGVKLNGQRYNVPVVYDMIQVIDHKYYTAQCNGNNGNSERHDTVNLLMNAKRQLKFTNFSALDNEPPDMLPPGIIRLPALDKKSGLSAIVYEGIPDNLPGISFTLDTNNVKQADSADVVIAIKLNANGTFNSYYCLTLTKEDAKYGLSKNRDTKYIPEQINLHLQYPVNLANWARELLELFPNLVLGPCTINYVNEKLDKLHQKASYQALQSDGEKRMAEYKSLAYDLVFGYLYCATDSAAAKDAGCGGQAAMGMLNELIASVDIDMMKEGLISLANTMGSFVQQNVNNVIDGVKEAAGGETGSGFFDYDRFVKSIMRKNIQQVDSFWQKASAVAKNFKKMYFTGCGTTGIDNGTYDLCCYRKGQLTMMVLPIVLTLGDYAVVKLTNLAARYGLRAEQAAKMLADAERLSANVVQDGNKLLIKESDDVGADIISTQERVDKDVVITGEQDLSAVIDDGDLITEVKPAPVPPTSSVITETPGNKANKWNKVLNDPLLPNKTYQSGTHTYYTDALGRIKEVNCSNLQKTARDRNTYQQTVKCKKVKDGLANDQGGHLIGSQFDGAGEQINLVPMKKSINQHPGSYAAMEQQWANVFNNGGTVTNVRMELIYSGASKRPIQINVKAVVNGVEQNYPHFN